MSNNIISFNKEDIQYFIEFKKTLHVVAVLDQIEEIIFGVEIFPTRGKYWTCTAEDVQDAYKNDLIDFTTQNHLMEDYEL